MRNIDGNARVQRSAANLLHQNNGLNRPRVALRKHHTCKNTFSWDTTDIMGAMGCHGLPWAAAMGLHGLRWAAIKIRGGCGLEPVAASSLHFAALWHFHRCFSRLFLSMSQNHKVRSAAQVLMDSPLCPKMVATSSLLFAAL